MRSASDLSSTPATATRMERSLRQSGASASGEKVSEGISTMELSLFWVKSSNG